MQRMSSRFTREVENGAGSTTFAPASATRG
jgi:hypothetical protein